ncbi:WD40 domain-containing protein [Rhizoctonia solani AG-1 IA]|uniref:WD40 domain-containing protein n=1 Tax=Thanatephorus cucumeris (strain AG1-IA) TaxID=983506 RepID=L8WJZ3_THACA|nr:WD40 domain-containing protein [Rhizoctonia solani AG-1 IA]
MSAGSIGVMTNVRMLHGRVKGIYPEPPLGKSIGGAIRHYEPELNFIYHSRKLSPKVIVEANSCNHAGNLATDISTWTGITMSDQPLKIIATCASRDPLASQITTRSVWHSQPTTLTGCYTTQNLVALALGCKDGSIFTFTSSAAQVLLDSKQPPSIQVPSDSEIASARKRAPMSAPHPGATSPGPTYRPLSPSAVSMSAFSNKSGSGTHTPNPLAIPSRARITQPGISRASIEAPKARVEVGDEQEKLRTMLARGSTAGGSNKGRRVSLGSLESFEGKDRVERKSGEVPRGPMSLARSVVDIALGGLGTKASATSGSAPILAPTDDESDDDTTSVISPSVSEATLATSAAVKAGLDLGSLKLQLRSHILPAHGGYGEAVTGLKAISDQDLYVCLQASGTLSLLSLNDGCCLASIHADDLPRLNPPQYYKEADSVAGSWEWVNMSLVPYIEVWTHRSFASAYNNYCCKSVVVIIVARPHPNFITTRSTRSRVAMYKIPEFNPETVPDTSVALEKVGEWFLEADVLEAGIMLAYVNNDGHVVISPLNMLPPPPEDDIRKPEEYTQPVVPSLGMIPIPNPFKTLKPRETTQLHLKPQYRDGRLLVGAERNLGMCLDWSKVDEVGEEILGMRVYAQALIGSDVLIVLWTSERVLVYTTWATARLKFEDWANTYLGTPWMCIFLQTESSFLLDNGLETYKIRKTDTNGDPSSVFKEVVNGYICSCDKTTGPAFRSQLQSAVIVSLMGQFYTVIAGTSPESGLTIGLQQLSKDSKLNENIWCSQANSGQRCIETTAVLPIDIDSIFVARSNGQLYRSTFSEFLSDPGLEPNKDILSPKATRLWSVTEEWSKTVYLLGALNDGGIACWDSRNLKLVARWTIFNTELETVINLSLGDDRLGKLKGSLMAVAADGTIAVIVLDSMHLHCIIPGSPAPLDRICIGGDNLLLFYSHGLARLWDMKTHEFWRSMQQNKGEELLDQGGWFEVWVHLCCANNISSPDASATLMVDVSSLSDLAGKHPTIGQPQERKPDIVRKQISQIIAAIAPCGMDDDVDKSCEGAFRTCNVGKVSWGLIRYVSDDAAGVWKVSPRYTALRLLSVVTLLRTAASFEDVSRILAFYVGCLANAVGPEFQPPSLSVLATFWVSSSDEVRQAARLLFESRLSQMEEAEVVQCVTFWREHLPTLQPLDMAHSPLAVQAAKHPLLKQDYSYVKDIAKSIALYLHDELEASTSPVNRILSIELSSRGFQVWQHHIDAMEMLRALFGFAMLPSGGGKNVGGKEARAAVLQIAASSTPLFMTTLSLDITQPKSTEHRRATMQLVAFIVRKQTIQKPLVLYPNLPRLVEAVVKSLDPNSTAARDAIVDAATEILAEVVRIVDFHTATQKLAVGTPEGAVIVYDLKTATRLYVLEGHSRRLTVLSFSPDGRRLATASLEESVVMVWKVGASFTSWFAPGVPPRQGHGHGEPFKRLDFNVGDEAYMTIAATLEWVNFTWPTDRTARLSIRDSIGLWRWSVRPLREFRGGARVYNPFNECSFSPSCFRSTTPPILFVPQSSLSYLHNQYTMIALRVATLTTLVVFVAAAPTPRPWDGGDAYTGVGGQAFGGSVYGGEGKGPLGLGPIKALNINSGNAGDGGAADSGVAVGGKGGDKWVAREASGKKGSKKGTSAGGSGGGNAYTGNGGQASGGNVYGESGISILNIGQRWGCWLCNQRIVIWRRCWKDDQLDACTLKVEHCGY